MKRYAIILLILLFGMAAYADKIIFEYRTKDIEIIVRSIDANEPDKPPEGGPNEPAEPNEPVEPNEPPAFAWFSPDSVIDPNGAWSADTKIIDANTTTYAVARVKNQPLILNLAEPALSGKCRLYMRSTGRYWKIEIFYDSAWHSHYEGNIEAGLFEITYPQKTIQKARIFQTGGSNNGSISEFEFYAVVPASAEPNKPPGGGPNEPTEPNEPNEPVIWTSFDVQWPILWGDGDVYMMQMKTVNGKIETNTYGK